MRQIPEREGDRHQIEQHAQRAREAVFGTPPPTRANGHRDLDEAIAPLADERRDEPMLLPIEPDLRERLSPIGFERRAEIFQRDAREPGGEPVGDARGETARHPGVRSLAPPPADQVVPFGQLLQQPRDIARIVLQIPIHGDDDLSPSVIEPCGQCRRLSEVPTQAQHMNARIPFVEAHEPLIRPIRAPIVHEDQLVGFSDGLHDGGHFPPQRLHIPFLIPHGDDDGVPNRQSLRRAIGSLAAMRPRHRSPDESLAGESPP
jgi:hypothetical protein